MRKRDPKAKLCARASILLIATFLAGCESVKLNTELPADTPKVWSFDQDTTHTPISRGIIDFTDDPTLRVFLEKVSHNNPDLESARSRLRSSMAVTRAENAQIWPSLGLGLSKTGDNQTPNAETGLLGNGRQHRVGLELSWEADLFGKLRDRNKANLNSQRSREWQYYTAKDALLARSAQQWVHAVSLYHSLTLAKSRVTILDEIVERSAKRYSGGLGDSRELDAARTRQMLALSQLSEVETSYQQSLRLLGTLAGQYVKIDFSEQPLYPSFDFPSALTPKEVLFNRPDIQIALSNLEAARYQKRWRNKSALPVFSIGANHGKHSIQLSDLLDSRSAWDWTLSLTKSVFDAGSEKNLRIAASWEVEAAENDLKAAVLQAVREIRDTVELEKKMARQTTFLRRAVSTAQSSYQYFEKRYREGLDPIVLMLNAKEEKLAIESQLNELQAARLVNRIDAVLAMGYGKHEEISK